MSGEGSELGVNAVVEPSRAVEHPLAGGVFHLISTPGTKAHRCSLQGVGAVAATPRFRDGLHQSGLLS